MNSHHTPDAVARLAKHAASLTDSELARTIKIMVNAIGTLETVDTMGQGAAALSATVVVYMDERSARARNKALEARRRRAARLDEARARATLPNRFR